MALPCNLLFTFKDLFAILCLQNSQRTSPEKWIFLGFCPLFPTAHVWIVLIFFVGSWWTEMVFFWVATALFLSTFHWWCWVLRQFGSAIVKQDVPSQNFLRCKKQVKLNCIHEQEKEHDQDTEKKTYDEKWNGMAETYWEENWEDELNP